MIQGVGYIDGTGMQQWVNFPTFRVSPGTQHIPAVAVDKPIIIYGYYTPPAANTLITGTVGASSTGVAAGGAPVQATDDSGGWRVTIAAFTFSTGSTIDVSTSVTGQTGSVMIVNNVKVDTIDQKIFIANPIGSGNE